MLTVNDFYEPTEHPFGMLEGYDRASEKESVLAWFLKACIKAGSFGPTQATHNHPTMVDDGLLIQTGDKEYALTRKAQGLLYGYYGKDNDVA